MVRHKGLTLRVLVSILVVISVLTTLIVCAIVGYQNDKRSLIDNTLELNRINAEKLALTADDLLRSATDTLRLSAEHLGDDSGQHRQFDLDLVKESNHIFNSVFLTNADGVVLQSSPETIGITGKQLTSDAARQALERKIPLVSEPYISLTQRYIILVSVPVFDRSGAYRGFVGGSIYLDEPNVFETMLGTQSNSVSGSYIYVVSKEGELLYHPDKKRIGQHVLGNEAVRKAIGGNSGAQRVTNTKGVDMLAGYAAVPSSRWGIISQTPAAAITDSSRKLINHIFLYSVPVLVLLLMLAFLLIRYISLPLYKLANFAERLNSNESSQIPDIHHWNYEANELEKTMRKAVDALQNRIHTLSVEARKDTLTGLNNRRTMERILADWVSAGTPFCYTILDIDRFKSINDTYGHQTGDEVLRFAARHISEHADQDAVCCRYGGEEFVILTPGGDLEEAYRSAERIRRSIEAAASPIDKPITLSAGVASIADRPGDLADAMQRADEALYRAKASGRNRVSMG